MFHFTSSRSVSEVRVTFIESDGAKRFRVGDQGIFFASIRGYQESGLEVSYMDRDPISWNDRFIETLFCVMLKSVR